MFSLRFTEEQKQEIIKTNQDLTKRFPWLTPHNVYTGEIVEDYDFSWTLLDMLNKGWRIAFGEKMCEEIQAGIDTENIKNFNLIGFKEKYGTLCIEANGTTDELDKVLRKYEMLSYLYCIECGKPTYYKTIGWVYYLCKDCGYSKFKGMRAHKLSSKDIPEGNNVPRELFEKVWLKHEEI